MLQAYWCAFDQRFGVLKLFAWVLLRPMGVLIDLHRFNQIIKLKRKCFLTSRLASLSQVVTKCTAMSPKIFIQQPGCVPRVRFSAMQADLTENSRFVPVSSVYCCIQLVWPKLLDQLVTWTWGTQQGLSFAHYDCVLSPVLLLTWVTATLTVLHADVESAPSRCI